MDRGTPDIEERIFGIVSRKPGLRFAALVTILSAVVVWGIVAALSQATEGLLVTGMRDQIFWGLYIVMFEFFLGVGMAGTFLSALLRLLGADWRGPITRVAEIVAVSALISGLLMITADLGRPDRGINMILFARWESPLIWDIFGISTYLAGSWLYFYFGAVPDIGAMRDRYAPVARFPLAMVLHLAAIGWRGTTRQVKIYEAAMGTTTVVVLIVAVMMNAVASWIFSMTLRTPWDNPMFGLYFVSGAVYSGTGVMAIVLFLVRRYYKLDDVITPRHFALLGYFLAVFAAVIAFFNVSDLLLEGYKMSEESSFYIGMLIRGPMSVYFWTYMWLGLITPLILMSLPITRVPVGVVIAGVLANVGMFLERFVVVVGGLSVPLTPSDSASYTPTWVEWSISAAGLALFALAVVVLMKIVPPISLWEIKKCDRENALRATRYLDSLEGSG